jgi:hypothetical protein
VHQAEARVIGVGRQLEHEIQIRKSPAYRDAVATYERQFASNLRLVVPAPPAATLPGTYRGR